MFKLIVVLAIGVCIGYFVGFGDAKTHDENVLKRIVSSVGGGTRGAVGNDIDAKMEKVSKQRP